MYPDRKVFINNDDLTVGNTAKLTYSGELTSMSEEIYVHLGYGLLWENLTEIKMSRVNNKYFAYIPVLDADSLNFCFRNNNNQWDNNLGSNYSYEIKKSLFSQLLEQNSEINVETQTTLVETTPQVVVSLSQAITNSSCEKQVASTTTNTKTDVAIEMPSTTVTEVTEKQMGEIDIEIACSTEPTIDVNEEVYGYDMISEDQTKTTRRKTYTELTQPISIPTKKSNSDNSKIKSWKSIENYSEDDEACLNISDIQINNIEPSISKIACNSINIENVHKINADTFHTNTTITNIVANTLSNNTENYSSIPTNMSLAPIRKVSEDYLRKKRIKIAMYRVFAYIPRLVTGNGRKNRGLWK